MNIQILSPRKALNKAFLKVKPNRSEIENFKTNLITLLNRINDNESEEFHKNLIIDFLKKTYYDPNHFINTKGRNDLVIHNGNSAKTSVGVIIEAKKPTNKAEMLTKDKLNVKAFQELVLYYLRERITQKNIEIKYLIATNIYEWFIFDAAIFDRLFAQNKNFVKQFNDFESGRLADTKTDFFYKQVAEPFIAEIKHDIEFTYFDIREYEKTLRNTDKNDDKQLIALFKLLSPEHLLKLPFANDSNSLDKRFYSELLHIIGLTETKKSGKKLIERKKEGERNTGSLIENAIIQLESLDKISRLENPSQFGATLQEQLFNVALELSITWINRILFLKLLEAQLISYHKGDKSYEFLTIDKIKDYDDVNSLFFQVLARKYDERNEDVKAIFEKVPYLNSSLFEPTDLEQLTLFISNLKDDKTIPIFSQTVLKDQQGKKRTGNINTLEYLFEFLNAYDFGSEGGEEIQEDNKTLINASVLGLIFEKINGYKDGSFFTPGFITMFMCRETIRKAVVQKFNEYCLSNDLQDYKISKIEDIYELIPHKISRKKANAIINSLKICDPAVGSGHFLVSALNEMIAIKNDLKILEDREGKSLHRYEIEVVNDELVVTDEDGELFEYNPHNKESQRVQETLFHEKQTIIENCLFGVDINPNSVKICRLRLWIELLKNAYYKNSTELETLPNIDINIKCGNSLVSRFAIDADLKQALKSSKWTIDTYRTAVDTYRNAQNKEQKHQMVRLINEIKTNFQTEISQNDPKVKKLRKLSGELFQMTNQGQLFKMNEKEKADWNKKIEQLTAEIKKLEKEIDEIKSNKIFENAFEWRFEFPEVLNDDGDFVGFDVVIGNPPYIQLQAIKETSEELKRFEYKTYEKTGDIYTLFYERGNQILKQNGFLAYITSNKWMRAGYGKSIRNYFLTHTQPLLLIDLGGGVFEEATVDSNILIFQKKNYEKPFDALDISKEKKMQNLNAYTQHTLSISPKINESWTIASPLEQSLKEKIERMGKPLKDWDVNIYRGVLTGLNEAFIITTEKRNEILANCKTEEERQRTEAIIKPILRGRDIKRYYYEWAGLWVIGTFPALRLNIEDYPAIKKYFLDHFDIRQLEQSGKKYPELDFNARKKTGNEWFETQDQIAYYPEFEKEKVVWKALGLEPTFSLVPSGIVNNDKANLLTSNRVSLKFLVGVFNSIFFQWIFKGIGINMGHGFEYKIQFVEKIPLAPITPTNQPIVAQIEVLVDKILAAKHPVSPTASHPSTRGEYPQTDTSHWEREIDRLVYELYDLTEEEIKIIENK